MTGQDFQSEACRRIVAGSADGEAATEGDGLKVTRGIAVAEGFIVGRIGMDSLAAGAGPGFTVTEAQALIAIIRQANETSGTLAFMH